MGEIDVDDLTAEIVRRLLRSQRLLTDEEYDDLAGEIMVVMGVAAMRKAEARAFRRQAIRMGERASKVVPFPGRRPNDGE